MNRILFYVHYFQLSSLKKNVQVFHCLNAIFASLLQAFVEPEHHPDPNIRGLPSDLSNWPYGEMGVGVTLVPEAMSAKEAAKRTTMYKNHAFEEYVSELISLDRFADCNIRMSLENYLGRDIGQKFEMENVFFYVEINFDCSFKTIYVHETFAVIMLDVS